MIEAADIGESYERPRPPTLDELESAVHQDEDEVRETAKARLEAWASNREQ